MKRLLLLSPLLILASLLVRFATARQPGYVTFVFDHPDAHLNVAYWSDPTFLSEREAELSIWYFDAYDQKRPHDMTGRYFNFRDGYRVTTGQPTGAAPTLWLFGNSTMSGTEVPDDETIASAMQRLVGSAYRVVNAGIMGCGTPQIAIAVQRAPIHAGDVVMVLSGAGDTPSDYTRYLALSRRAALERGAAFIAFLQPSAALGHDTPYLEAMLREVYPGETLAYDRERILVLRGQAVDLSGLFASSDHEHFLDMNHLNGAGNAAVAQAMFDALRLTF